MMQKKLKAPWLLECSWSPITKWLFSSGLQTFCFQYKQSLIIEQCCFKHYDVFKLYSGYRLAKAKRITISIATRRVSREVYVFPGPETSVSLNTIHPNCPKQIRLQKILFRKNLQNTRSRDLELKNSRLHITVSEVDFHGQERHFSCVRSLVNSKQAT